jgi:excisionase family DNA binding protein
MSNQPDFSPGADRLGELKPMLTIPEVSAFLAVSERTVRRLVHARQIPCVRIGCQIRFDRSDLLRWTLARREE